MLCAHPQTHVYTRVTLRIVTARANEEDRCSLYTPTACVQATVYRVLPVGERTRTFVISYTRSATSRGAQKTAIGTVYNISAASLRTPSLCVELTRPSLVAGLPALTAYVRPIRTAAIFYFTAIRNWQLHAQAHMTGRRSHSRGARDHSESDDQLVQVQRPRHTSLQVWMNALGVLTAVFVELLEAEVMSSLFWRLQKNLFYTK